MGFCSHHHQDSSYLTSASTSTASPILAVEGFYLAQYNAERRRSVDTGGLALALRDVAASTTGTKALAGWTEHHQSTTIPYAEMLSRLYTQTQPSTCLPPPPSPNSPPSPQTRARLLSAISSWSFDSLSLSPDDLFTTTLLIFDTLFAIDSFSPSTGGVTRAQLRPLLHALRSVYGWHDNTYHNFQHAVDVLQAMYVFLADAGCVPPVSVLEDVDEDGAPRETGWKRGEGRGVLKELLSDVDVFMLFLAAIGHDAGHPGLNNGFMKSAGTCLSAMYNHTSTLERMHCTLLLQLMRNFGLGHLIRSDNVVLFPSPSTFPLSSSNSSESEREQPEVETTNIRQLLTDTILATDMSLHFGWIKAFEELIDGMGRPATPISLPQFESTTGLSMLSPEAKLKAKTFACQALMKCADISNPVRPHAISESWSRALLNEWAGQAVLEGRMGVVSSVPSKGPPPARASIFSAEALEEPGTSHSHIQHHLSSLPPSASHIHPQNDWSQTDLNSAIEQVRVQTGFIAVFTSPLYKQLARFAPELGHFWGRCVRNAGVWEEVGVELAKIVVPAPLPTSSTSTAEEGQVEAEREQEEESETEIDTNDGISPGLSDFSFTTGTGGGGRRRTSLESAESGGTETSLSSVLTTSACDDDDEDGEEDLGDGEERDRTYLRGEGPDEGEEEADGEDGGGGEYSFSSNDTASASAQTGTPTKPTTLAAILRAGHTQHSSTAFSRHARNYSTSSSLSRSSYYTARSSASVASSSGSSGSVRGSSSSASASAAPSPVQSQSHLGGVGVLKRDFTFGVHPATNPFVSPHSSSSISPLSHESAPLTPSSAQTLAWHSNSNSTASTSTTNTTTTATSTTSQSEDLHYRTYHPLPLSLPLPQNTPSHVQAHRGAEYRPPLGIEAMRAAYRASSRKYQSEYYEHRPENSVECECEGEGDEEGRGYPVPVALEGLGHWEFPYRRRSVGPGGLLSSHSHSRPHAGRGGRGGFGVGGGPTVLVRESVR